MSSINQLSSTTPTLGDLLALYSGSNGDTRKCSVNALLSFFQDQFASPTMSVQYATPTDGFSVAVSTSSTAHWLILQPAGGLTSGTVTLPLATSALDGQEVLVTSTQAITTLTVSLNGASAANGAPTAMTANAFFRLRFYADTNSWYRVA